MKKGNSEPLPPGLAAELAALEALPDESINTTAIPEVTDWSGAERGRFYKPRKRQKTLRIDADVLAWFESQGPGHLTRMNQALRAEMLRDLQRRARETAPGQSAPA
jgi:uncharacterized protein (DUF4415 family)